MPGNSNCKQLNHALILVGIDRDELGEFYILRNSHGSDWGEIGYFRIYLQRFYL
jgi:C1A family cysteine protease